MSVQSCDIWNMRNFQYTVYVQHLETTQLKPHKPLMQLTWNVWFYHPNLKIVFSDDGSYFLLKLSSLKFTLNKFRVKCTVNQLYLCIPRYLGVGYAGIPIVKVSRHAHAQWKRVDFSEWMGALRLIAVGVARCDQRRDPCIPVKGERKHAER